MIHELGALLEELLGIIGARDGRMKEENCTEGERNEGA
jgi:hypothetical protein